MRSNQRALILWRRELFIRVEIDFAQAPPVLKHKCFRRIAFVNSHRLRELIGDRDLVVILWPGDRDLGGQQGLASAAKSLLTRHS